METSRVELVQCKKYRPKLASQMYYMIKKTAKTEQTVLVATAHLGSTPTDVGVPDVLPLVAAAPPVVSGASRRSPVVGASVVKVPIVGDWVGEFVSVAGDGANMPLGGGTITPPTDGDGVLGKSVVSRDGAGVEASGDGCAVVAAAQTGKSTKNRLSGVPSKMIG